MFVWKINLLELSGKKQCGAGTGQGDFCSHCSEKGQARTQAAESHFGNYSLFCPLNQHGFFPSGSGGAPCCTVNIFVSPFIPSFSFLHKYVYIHLNKALLQKMELNSTELGFNGPNFFLIPYSLKN